MKTLFALICALVCGYTSSLIAAEGYYGQVEFPVASGFLPISYQYNIADVTACEPLVKNEIYRMCLVRDKRSADFDFVMTDTTPPAVSIDAAGQLVLGEYAESAKWMTLRWTEVKDGVAQAVVADYITAGEIAGVPHKLLYTDKYGTPYYGFDAYTEEDLPAGEGSVYVYLVVMDTRQGTGDCAGLPYHVKAYGMALCKATEDTPEMSFNFPFRTWLVGGVSSTAITVYWPGSVYAAAWQPAAAIESLVVTQNGAQVTLTGDELAAYLKPNVNSFEQGVEDGKPVLNLAVTAPDVQYYTLYTKAKLSDSEWTKFEDYAKTLDNVDGKYYTRFRIDGESPLKIPVLTGETSRFYQLRGE